MNPNLLQTIMQMRNLQKQTKLEENCAESSSTCKTENNEKEEINEENLLTNDNNLEEINQK
uniref:Uncharacterized protein n=1 Tax=Meloidogyne enterolobii TaxID=390850 RepID=A0A6V7WGW8_MELEN|nr:unnamed protein product [Meloidogyne enterolobii]